MTKTVLVIVSTKPQTFPVGTVETKFTFTIKFANGDVASTVDTDSTGATFPLVEPGDYTAEVTKNGVTATQAFTVVKDAETFAVPDTLTITFS